MNYTAYAVIEINLHATICHIYIQHNSVVVLYIAD